jgi:hypothetical protein
MVTARATAADGTELVLLGLTRENVTRLVAGSPIHVSAATHPGFPLNLKILICFGETVGALTESLRPVIDGATKIIAVLATDPSIQ